MDGAFQCRARCVNNGVPPVNMSRGPLPDTAEVMFRALMRGAAIFVRVLICFTSCLWSRIAQSTLKSTKSVLQRTSSGVIRSHNVDFNPSLSYQPIAPYKREMESTHRDQRMFPRQHRWASAVNAGDTRPLYTHRVVLADAILFVSRGFLARIHAMSGIHAIGSALVEDFHL